MAVADRLDPEAQGLPEWTNRGLEVGDESVPALGGCLDQCRADALTPAVRSDRDGVDPVAVEDEDAEELVGLLADGDEHLALVEGGPKASGLECEGRTVDHVPDGGPLPGPRLANAGHGRAAPLSTLD